MEAFSLRICLLRDVYWGLRMEFSLLGWPRHLLQGMRAQWMVLGGWNWYNSYAFTLNRPQPNWTLMGAMCYRALSCVRQRSEEWKERKKKPEGLFIYLFHWRTVFIPPIRFQTLEYIESRSIEDVRVSIWLFHSELLNSYPEYDLHAWKKLLKDCSNA